MNAEPPQRMFASDPGEWVDSGDSARILIVDDHRENIAALEAVLEPLGQPLISAALPGA
jgi:PleD family two-component response regulator